MVPSLDTAGVPGAVSGSVALMTCGSPPTFFIVCATAWDWSVTFPCSAWKRIWPL